MISGGMVLTNGSAARAYVAGHLNLHVSRVWGGSVDVMGTAITGATVSVNGVLAARQGERFLARVAVDNATQAVETNLTVVAVWFGSSVSVVRSP